MKLTYVYKGRESHAFASPTVEEDKSRYAVLFEGNIATILRTQFSSEKTIWVQRVLPGEQIWPHELIQALGEAIQGY